MQKLLKEERLMGGCCLFRCLAMDATDGRTYVALGKLLTQQRRSEEARAVYEEGCTATAGANAHIWQAWATLEARSGNTSKARKVRLCCHQVHPILPPT